MPLASMAGLHDAAPVVAPAGGFRRTIGIMTEPRPGDTMPTDIAFVSLC
jgi:hypothetical protein